MYGQNFSGVRVRLPSNMFVGRKEPMIFEKGGAVISRAPPCMAGAMPLPVNKLRESIASAEAWIIIAHIRHVTRHLVRV